MASKRKSECNGGECRSLRVNFRAFVTCTTKAPSRLSVGDGTKMDQKLVDILNGRQDLFDEIGEATVLHNEDKREVMVMGKARSGFPRKSKIKKGGSSVQVADSVEVEEHVERLVRCAHFRLEDSETQQVRPPIRWKSAKPRSR